MTEAFHPARNLPGCMMPDGGECCAGHVAVVEDWHKQRAENAALKSRVQELTKALEAFLANHETAGCGSSIFQVETAVVEQCRRALAPSLEGRGGAT